jgi:tetratricopeptide (TPR) repeat protein
MLTKTGQSKRSTISDAIRGKDNSGVISVNGAAAHKAKVGDLLIIASYASYNEAEVKNYTTYKEAIKIKPDYHGAYYNMGIAYGELKKYQEAIDAYKEAIKIKSDYHHAYTNCLISMAFLQALMAS